MAKASSAPEHQETLFPMAGRDELYSVENVQYIFRRFLNEMLYSCMADGTFPYKKKKGVNLQGVMLACFAH